MANIDLPTIRHLYRDGINIIDHLRLQLGANYNTDQLVEISYDMQAGSYVEYVQQHSDRIDPYRQELAAHLSSCICDGDVVVDVGTGEMTTLETVASTAYARINKAYALDISLSRLIVGKRYLDQQLPKALANKVQPVVSTLFRLPFADSSVDVVWTSHALEPNGGRELEAISELARISRRHIVLFEPSYENNSNAGRERMDRLGYIRNLPGAISAVPGLELENIVKIEKTENPLNPTYAYICRKTEVGEQRDCGLVCPLGHGRLEQRDGYVYSRSSLLAYPMIEGIPVLRVDKAICASVLDKEIK